MAHEAGPGPAGVLDAAASSAHFRTGRHLHGRPVVAIYTPDSGSVRAGSFLFVESDVELLIGGNHRLDWVTTFPVREIFDLPGARVGIPWSKGDIVIGHGVRLGRGARAISSVTIGDGAEVAPGSVVVRDVRPYTVVAGNPAREVGLRFDQDIVERLAATRWWEWYDDLTLWRLDRLTRGQGHLLVPQLGRDRPAPPRAALRRAAAHLLRGVAHRLDGTGQPVQPQALEPQVDAGDAAEPVAQVTMGRASYGSPTVRGSVDRVTIGAYCSIAPGSTIFADGPGPAGSGGGVRIGSDVWVGRQADICSGVTIGDGAVVAAYARVSDDVRPFAVVAGNPAREVKRRFDDATVDALLRIHWWEWTEELVRERAQELCCDDVTAFIERYDTQPAAVPHPQH